MDGRTGYLFPPGDATALAQRLQSLAQDPAVAYQMGQRGRMRAREHFARDRMVGETAVLYGRLLSDKLRSGRVSELGDKSGGTE